MPYPSDTRALLRDLNELHGLADLAAADAPEIKERNQARVERITKALTPSHAASDDPRLCDHDRKAVRDFEGFLAVVSLHAPPFPPGCPMWSGENGCAIALDQQRERTTYTLGGSASVPVPDEAIDLPGEHDVLTFIVNHVPMPEWLYRKALAALASSKAPE